MLFIDQMYYVVLLTHHHINTMTTSHSPADDGRKNSSENSCYAYIYCYFYVFTQLYKSLKYYYVVVYILDALCTMYIVHCTGIMYMLDL